MRRGVLKRVLGLSAIAALSLAVAGCGGGSGGGDQSSNGSTSGGGGSASGSVNVEGSSTVAPITQAAAEAYSEQNPDVNITVGSQGTGNGFEAFCAGDTDISDASRPIDQAEELPTCQENGIEFIALPVGLDGISVVANPQNDWASNLSVEELRTIWQPESQGEVNSWNDVRSEFPDNELALFGPGTESGTFDFFTEVVVGEEGSSRSDYQASEDDNVLVQGVSGNPNALGYFGFSFYERNQDQLKLLSVDGVEPNRDTISSGEYPLSRPLFIYVNANKLENNPALQDFVSFYLENVNELVQTAQYVTLPDSTLELTREQFEQRQTGPLYNENGELPEGGLEAALEQSQ
ncbi:PstS family phosphate ABC transporter substrate-binding protein [soil metagenome]